MLDDERKRDMLSPSVHWDPQFVVFLIGLLKNSAEKEQGGEMESVRVWRLSAARGIVMACQRGGDRQVGHQTPVDFTRLQKQNTGGRNRMVYRECSPINRIVSFIWDGNAGGLPYHFLFGLFWYCEMLLIDSLAAIIWDIVSLSRVLHVHS
jgi:hypothetical protein